HLLRAVVAWSLSQGSQGRDHVRRQREFLPHADDLSAVVHAGDLRPHVLRQSVQLPDLVLAGCALLWTLRALVGLAGSRRPVVLRLRPGLSRLQQASPRVWRHPVTSRPVIAVEHLSKAFKIYRDPRDMLWELLSSRPRHTETWALRDVSFQVDAGEVVGVIGRNGAGKSTLLKIIAGTMEPTAGKLTANGSIAAILELGTGFNLDYSGREGIVMGGLCMGMSRKTIEERIDEIIAFSELEDAIEHPLRTYSTGMRMRLAFATAIATDAQTLIIDEALAVGDTLFQAKCMDKLEEIKRSGRTVF